MDSADLDNRFTYHEPKEGQRETYQGIRDASRVFADIINEKAPEGREKSLAMTKLEESVMWTIASIARSK